MLLERNILPVSNHEEWQGFRDNLLYTSDVDRVFEARRESLRKVHQLYHDPVQQKQQKHPYLTLDNAIDLFV